MRSYKVKPIHALARGLAVLQSLQRMQAASLHDLHLATGLPKSTLTRILYTLHLQGLVWQRMADGAYLASHSLHERAQIDDTAWLVEIASPVLQELGRRTNWPSVLTVPRLDYMEVIETNSSQAYFDLIRRRPIGYRLNYLRSASGRAYLAFCSEQEREAVLRRLREGGVPGNEKASDEGFVRELVRSGRRNGYGVRTPDFGGDYARTRREADDGRSSMAMPIVVDGQVLGCMNLTWRTRVISLARMAERHGGDLREAIRQVEQRIAQTMDPPSRAVPRPSVNGAPRLETANRPRARART
ncbi:MAG TPA: helix-turn-helix domain-containing protein [Zeimonas sp.]